MAKKLFIGTNTYLIGSQKPYILVDAAEGLESYLPILTSALQDSNSTSNDLSLATPDVSDIIISHWHYDHVGGLPSVLTLLKNLWIGRNLGREAEYQGPKLHKYPLNESATAGGEGKERHLGPHNILPDIEKTLQKELNLYTAAPNGSVFHDLYDGQKFVQGPGTTTTTTATLLEVLYTPGHSADSICLYLPIDRALYTADTVLGHGTAVFEDLAAYMKSLDKMLRFNETTRNLGEGTDELTVAYDTLYPGHGHILANGRETIATYIKHRMERETQIVEVLQIPVPVELQSSDSATDSDRQQRQLWTIWNLVRHIYKSYPENLWLPATRSVHLHLKKLEGEGIVRCVGGEGKDTVWELVAIPSGSSSTTTLNE